MPFQYTELQLCQIFAFLPIDALRRANLDQLHSVIQFSMERTETFTLYKTPESADWWEKRGWLRWGWGGWRGLMQGGRGIITLWPVARLLGHLQLFSAFFLRYFKMKKTFKHWYLISRKVFLPIWRRNIIKKWNPERTFAKLIRFKFMGSIALFAGKGERVNSLKSPFQL